MWHAPGDADRLLHPQRGLEGLPVQRVDRVDAETRDDEQQGRLEHAVRRRRRAERVFVHVAALERHVHP